MMKHSELKWFFIIAVLVVVTRAVFFFSAVPYSPVAQNRDNYLQIAQNVVVGKGFATGEVGILTSLRPPLTPYFFAVILGLFGDHTLAIAFANWFVDAVTCVLIYMIALEIFNNKQIAWVSSLLFIFYLPEIYYSWQAISEPLFQMLLAGFVFSFLQATRRPSIRGFALTGILLGATALTRSTTLFFLPVVILISIWLLRPWDREVVKWVATLSLAFSIVIIPWTIRNYVVFDKFIPINSNIGLTAFHGNHVLGEADFLRPRRGEEGNLIIRELARARFGSAELPMSYYDDIAKEETIKIIRQYPGRYVLLSTVRFFMMWYYIEGGPFARLGMLLLLPLNVLLVVLAALAFLYDRGEWRRQGLFLVILILFLNAASAAIRTNIRYIIPVIPYVLLLVAVTIVKTWSRIQHSYWSLYWKRKAQTPL